MLRKSGMNIHMLYPPMFIYVRTEKFGKLKFINIIFSSRVIYMCVYVEGMKFECNDILDRHIYLLILQKYG